MGSQLIGKFAKVAAAASATAAGYYAYRVYHNTAGIDTPIIASRSVPESLRQSWTVKELINRNDHPAVMDSQYTELAARFREVPDTVLLARFLRGFFGGYVFGPERVALKAVGLDLVHMSKIQDTAPAPAVWSTTELSDTALPALHTKLFGAFQVVDIALGDKASHVDIGFGSDTSEFGGVHRFAIQRTESSVQVHLQHLVCNPTKPKQLSPEILLDFHLLYAKMLFRESINAITR